MAPRVGNRLSVCVCVCRDGLCREMQKHMLMKQSSLIFQIKSRKDHNPHDSPSDITYCTNNTLLRAVTVKLRSCFEEPSDLTLRNDFV